MKRARMYTGLGALAIAALGALSIVAFFHKPSDPTARAAYTQKIADIGVRKGHWPGVMWAVIQDGAVLTTGAAGFADIDSQTPMTPDTIMPIGSITKVITGLSVAQAITDGHADLDRPLDAYLSINVAWPDNSPRNLRHLVTHTSGINDTDAGYDEAGYHFGATRHPDDLKTFLTRYLTLDGDLYDAAANFNSASAGTLYDYSNIAAGLAGLAIADATGTDFATYAMQNVVTPLGIDGFWGHMNDGTQSGNATLYDRNNFGDFEALPSYGLATWPDGQFNTSAIGLAQLLVAVINEGNVGGTQTLPASTIAGLTTPLASGLRGMATDEDQVGIYWSYETLDFLGDALTVEGHNGGDPGLVTMMYRLPDSDDGFVVMLNGEPDGTIGLVHAVRLLRALSDVPNPNTR